MRFIIVIIVVASIFIREALLLLVVCAIESLQTLVGELGRLPVVRFFFQDVGTTIITFVPTPVPSLLHVTCHAFVVLFLRRVTSYHSISYVNTSRHMQVIRTRYGRCMDGDEMKRDRNDPLRVHVHVYAMQINARHIHVRRYECKLDDAYAVGSVQKQAVERVA